MRTLPLTPVLLFMLLSCGCAQRIGAQVTAVAEEGYTPQGQSYRIALLPGHAPEARDMLPMLEERLAPALLELGYTTPPEDQKAQVDVRLYWYSTGPHPIFRLSPFDDDFRSRRYRGFHRRHVTIEEQFQRFLVVEALLRAPDTVGQSITTTPPPSEVPLPPQRAMLYLPPPPERILWRVIVESRGTMAKAERVLSEMLTAALPWIGKAAYLNVTVSGDTVVRSQPVQP